MRLTSKLCNNWRVAGFGLSSPLGVNTELRMVFLLLEVPLTGIISQHYVDNYVTRVYNDKIYRVLRS